MSCASAPQLHILATGGTIAGQAASASDHVGYRAAVLPVQQLLDAVPALQQLPARLHAEQILQKDSKDLDAGDWLRIAQATAAALAQPQVQGVVLTHGTDTLEETAWFLHRCLPAVGKPVVLVSAMRPAGALGADGPQNLLDACVLALSAVQIGLVRAGAGCQVLTVAAGRVFDALTVQKVQPYHVPAFSAGGAGPLAWVEQGRLRLARPCCPAGLAQDADLWAPGRYQALLHAAVQTPPPAVAWLSSHAGFDARQVRALVAAGFDGLLVAGTGNGTLHHALHEALCEAGVAVAVTSRCAAGAVVPPPAPAWPMLPLPPAKARLELQLRLWLERVKLSEAGSA
ncbi:asparaginase [Vandammella animalimorsus]|uniref:Asparaginase n=1 Tax=Vandammella animalimorsus TaxID=2029117 RepID=A0A3M6RQE3_9BURK|nr:asparaginase [Vandammella animalimorsus]RMX17569.1 asparaginase [Vandammella animalimorsus]